MATDLREALQVIKWLYEVPLSREGRKKAVLLLKKHDMFDGSAETRAQLDELAQVAEGSHRQHLK